MQQREQQRLFPVSLLMEQLPPVRCLLLPDRPTDDIEAVIKLWQGSKCIETWEASSVGDLAFSGTATVSRGKTYQLTVDVTLEGKAQPRFSVEGTCP